MRHAAFLVAVILTIACTARGQANSDSPASSSPFTVGTAQAANSLFAFVPPTSSSAPEDPASLALGAPADPPQGVYGVFQNYEWDVYAGYTFLRFYAVPNTTVNMNGFNFAVGYSLRDWVAVDGELMATFGSQFGVGSRFVLGMGGPRFRWQTQRGLELWVHGLAGGAHLTPQTAYGGEGAFGYEVGGGVDLNTRHRRLAYRVEADMVGTRFFGTYQYSPKIATGIVVRF